MKKALHILLISFIFMSISLAAEKPLSERDEKEGKVALQVLQVCTPSQTLPARTFFQDYRGQTFRHVGSQDVQIFFPSSTEAVSFLPSKESYQPSSTPAQELVQTILDSYRLMPRPLALIMAGYCAPCFLKFENLQHFVLTGNLSTDYVSLRQFPAHETCFNLREGAPFIQLQEMHPPQKKRKKTLFTVSLDQPNHQMETLHFGLRGGEIVVPQYNTANVVFRSLKTGDVTRVMPLTCPFAGVPSYASCAFSESGRHLALFEPSKTKQPSVAFVDAATGHTLKTRNIPCVHGGIQLLSTHLILFGLGELGDCYRMTLINPETHEILAAATLPRIHSHLRGIFLTPDNHLLFLFPQDPQKTEALRVKLSF